ncbi:hypothetical protein [Marinobacter sp.]|uniref:hypothetical protein n=1 Tax=Marinobacter sp. TaxID=50741 RepID=UPI0034A1B883
MNRFPLTQRARFYTVLALLVAIPITSLASTSHIPQPWRQEAVVQGRDTEYSTERFLHELTFRHRQAVPGPTDNGIRGTGGSVSSRRLYLDFRFRQDFALNTERQGFLLDIQRSEDFDGTYQRQLVGFRHNLTDDTQLWLQGDVFSDKAQSDIYFSARHYLAANHWLHASWILPDAYFNDKTESGDAFTRKPMSFFGQWHLGNPQADPLSGTTASITLSPASELNSRNENLVVENESLKAAFSHRRLTGHWRWLFAISGERTRRHYQFNEQDTVERSDFSRDHFLLDARATHPTRRFQPSFGLSYLRLEEDGFFGRERNEAGFVSRREPTLYADMTLPLSARSTLSPGVYLSHAEIRQDFQQSRDRRHSGFIGKFTLPLNMVISENDGAVLTLNPTFYLHQLGFGGGNLQLHWPM